MDSKGIFNMEMFISLTLLVIIFSIILSISTVEFSSIEETQNRKEARIIVSDISEIVTNVYVMGDGFSRKYELPPQINNETYVLQINDSGVYVNSHYQITYSGFFSNISFKSKKYNLKPGHVYEFSNNNNTIEVVQK